MQCTTVAFRMPLFCYWYTVGVVGQLSVLIVRSSVLVITIIDYFKFILTFQCNYDVQFVLQCTHPVMKLMENNQGRQMLTFWTKYPALSFYLQNLPFSVEMRIAFLLFDLKLQNKFSVLFKFCYSCGDDYRNRFGVNKFSTFLCKTFLFLFLQFIFLRWVVMTFFAFKGLHAS